MSPLNYLLRSIFSLNLLRIREPVDQSRLEPGSFLTLLANILEEKWQKDTRILAIVRVQIRVYNGVPSSHLEERQTINSLRRHALCDAVLTYDRNR